MYNGNGSAMNFLVQITEVIIRSFSPAFHPITDTRSPLNLEIRSKLFNSILNFNPRKKKNMESIKYSKYFMPLEKYINNRTSFSDFQIENCILNPFYSIRFDIIHINLIYLVYFECLYFFIYIYI